MLKLTLVFAMAALITAPSLAMAGEKKEADKKDPDAITCKYTVVVGSKIPQKICMTNFEWEDRRRAQMEAKRSSRNRNSSCSASGPC